MDPRDGALVEVAQSIGLDNRWRSVGNRNTVGPNRDLPQTHFGGLSKVR